MDEPMASEIYDKLTECDPGLAWELCRNYVGYQLLGQDGITVPYLDEAYHIIPFGVIAKKSKSCGGFASTFLRGCSKVTYSVIGSLSSLLDPQSDQTPFKQKPLKVTDMEFNNQYVYRITGMKNGIKKVIKIKVNGTECFDISLSVELGKLLLNRDLPQLQSVKKIFIIYAVFYASSISVSVMIGEQQRGTPYMSTSNRKFKHDRRMPVGFCAQKFPLMSNGCVGFMENSTCDGLRNGRWDSNLSVSVNRIGVSCASTACLPRFLSHGLSLGWQLNSSLPHPANNLFISRAINFSQRKKNSYMKYTEFNSFPGKYGFLNLLFVIYSGPCVSPRLQSDPLPTVPSAEALNVAMTGAKAVRRNPRDVLPGVPEERKNIPLPPIPVGSDSSD